MEARWPRQALLVVLVTTHGHAARAGGDAAQSTHRETRTRHGSDSMHHNWNGIEFTAPPGLADVTYHFYTNPEETESIELVAGRLAPNVAGLGELEEELAERISRDMGPLASIESVSKMTVAGRSSKRIDINLTVGLSRRRLRVVHVPAGERRYFKLSHVARARDRLAEDRFVTVVGSIGSVQKAELPSVPKEYHRYRCGDLAIAIPTDLEGPNRFSFEGKERSPTLEVVMSRVGDERHPNLDVTLARDRQYGGEVRDLKTEQFGNHYVRGQLTTYQLLRDEVSGIIEEARVHMALSNDNGILIAINATGARCTIEALRALVLATAESIRSSG